MSPHYYLDKILPILSAVRDDTAQLAKILSFLETEILPRIEDDAPIKIPEKFEAKVRAIAQGISAGFVCYLNLETLELEEIPEADRWRLVDDPEVDEAFPVKHREWAQVQQFAPLPSRESFQIMEDFAAQLSNTKVQNRIIDILNNRKPFAHFNHFIHQSPYSENWFAFKDAAYEAHVREAIYDQLQEK